MHKTESSLVCKVLGQSSTQLDAIRPTLTSLLINRACTQRSSLPAFLNIWVHHLPQNLGVLTRTTSPTPTHGPSSGSNSSGVPTTPGSYRLRGSAASSGETQEICGVFQSNLTETGITTMLSQSAACQNLPGAKWLCSCTLKSLPEVHAMVNTPSARGTATANKNVGTYINPPMAKMKFCIILGGKNSVLCSESQGGEREMNFYKPILRAVIDLSLMVKLSLVSSHIFCVFILIKVSSCHYPATPFSSSLAQSSALSA